jgi:hypothetical protein
MNIRFMVQGVFKRNVRDPTAYNPPRFVLAGKYSSLPKISEIDATMSRASFILAKVRTVRTIQEKRFLIIIFIVHSTLS